jgi:hypothetical protein
LPLRLFGGYGCCHGDTSNEYARAPSKRSCNQENPNLVQGRGFSLAMLPKREGGMLSPDDSRAPTLARLDG